MCRALPRPKECEGKHRPKTEHTQKGLCTGAKPTVLMYFSKTLPIAAKTV